MNRPTLFIFLDACGYNCINPVDTPTLFELSKKSVVKKTYPVTGFCQRTPMLTGTYPQTSGHFVKYYLNPEDSPFKWLKNPLLSWLIDFSEANFPLIKLFSREALRRITKIITKSIDPYPSYIPVSLLPFFDLADNKFSIEKELRDLPNIFSICNNYGKKYMYEFPKLPVVKSSLRSFDSIKQVLRKGENFDFLMIHNVLLDVIGHRKMTKSTQFKDALRFLDQQIKTTLELLERNYDSYSTIIASDHGMVSVDKKINMLEVLSHSRYKPFEDYLCFLDSTAARFWFSDPIVEKELVSILSNLQGGHIISKAEKVSLKIDFNHRKFGDLFFWVDKGYVLSPNFFQVGDNPPRGMHGYIDEKNEQLGVLIAYSSEAKFGMSDTREIIPLVDVFPTILTSMNLPIPKTCEGKSCVLLR
jgi:predicted AlkP superfamily pyrophosphatase or phosphodiesterase